MQLLPATSSARHVVAHDRIAAGTQHRGTATSGQQMWWWRDESHITWPQHVVASMRRTTSSRQTPMLVGTATSPASRRSRQQAQRPLEIMSTRGQTWDEEGEEQEEEDDKEDDEE